MVGAGSSMGVRVVGHAKTGGRDLSCVRGNVWTLAPWADIWALASPIVNTIVQAYLKSIITLLLGMSFFVSKVAASHLSFM
jgi:hypothetical protein